MRRFLNDLGLSGLLATLVVATTGCPDRPVAKIDPNPVKQNGSLIPVNASRELDILFVIDDSGSMQGEQDSLLAAFPKFMGVLKNIEGGAPNMHIAVISSNSGIGDVEVTGADACKGKGDNGVFETGRGTADCELNGNFIIDGVNNGTPEINYSAARGLEGTFQCIADLGTNGCGFEQHLESMKRALDPAINGESGSGQNVGFLRPDAYLAVIFLADEDDCSTSDLRMFNPAGASLTSELGPMESYRCTEFGIECDGATIGRTNGSFSNCVPRNNSPYMYHPDAYANWLKDLKGDPNLIIVSTVVGNPDPVATALDDGVVRLLFSCSDGPNPNVDNAAAPGVRLDYFRQQFTNNQFTSICQNNLEAGLEQVALLLKQVLGDRCIQGDIANEDIDEGRPGIQLECSVEDVIKPNTENETSTAIRRCEMVDDTTAVGGQEYPCWFVAADATCDGPSGLKFVVERGGVTPPNQSYERFACVAN